MFFFIFISHRIFVWFLVKMCFFTLSVRPNTHFSTTLVPSEDIWLMTNEKHLIFNFVFTVGSLFTFYSSFQYLDVSRSQIWAIFCRITSHSSVRSVVIYKKDYTDSHLSPCVSFSSKTRRELTDLLFMTLSCSVHREHRVSQSLECFCSSSFYCSSSLSSV